MFVMPEARIFEGATLDFRDEQEIDWDNVLSRLGVPQLQRLLDIMDQVDAGHHMTETERQEIIAMFAAADVSISFAA
ncbi:hypothetical protein [Methyloraptor flagellatus]|uniref:Uncharacterized protein n=1 Tax=Methyloraptor flagellatus TaxID=3162530 RepID=A0AAU7X9J1_9HYPH